MVANNTARNILLTVFLDTYRYPWSVLYTYLQLHQAQESALQTTFLIIPPDV